MAYLSLSDDELDFQYACSKWSVKSVPDEEVNDDFIRITLEESERVRADVPHSRHIRYGGMDAATPNMQTYDIYGIDLPKDSGIVVFIHGGYWQALTKDSSANLVRPLYNQGYKVIVPDYDLCPAVTLKDIIREIKELILHILTNPDIPSRDIWLAGHSAGAHLCSTFLSPELQNALGEVQKQRIRGLVLISGVYDLLPLLPTRQIDDVALDKCSAVECSTSTFFQREFAGKLVIAHGHAESPEFYRQSFEIHQTALEAGTESQLLVIEDADHFTVIENLNDPNFSLTRQIVASMQ